LITTVMNSNTMMKKRLRVGVAVIARASGTVCVRMGSASFYGSAP
jgi:hypothetical protein